jgi:hypothetical protein
LFQRLITRQSKKALLASLLVTATVVTTGCSSLPETVTGVGNTHWGYRSYDPCIRCGESWMMLPNASVAASNKTISEPVEVQEPTMVVIK